MPRRTRLQTIKDVAVIVFCLVGLLYMVSMGADRISQVLNRPLAKPKPKAAPAAGAPAEKSAAPAGKAAEAEGKDAEDEGIPTKSELTDLFSGASAFALIMFSLLLALAAIIGWQSLRHDVEMVKTAAEEVLEKAAIASSDNVARVSDLASSVETTNKKFEEELRGRVDAVMGTLIGTLHSVPTEADQSETDQAYLAEAIHHAKQGYERLKKLPGNGKYVALNSLVYYSTLLRLPRRAELLEQAQDLRDIGRKYQDRSTVAPYLITYARAMLVYSSDRAEIEEALGTIQDVLGMGGITKLSEREALFIKDSLSTKLAALPA